MSHELKYDGSACVYGFVDREAASYRPGKLCKNGQCVRYFADPNRSRSSHVPGNCCLD